MAPLARLPFSRESGSAASKVQPPRLKLQNQRTCCIWSDLLSVESGSQQIRIAKHIRPQGAKRRGARFHPRDLYRANIEGDGTMQSEARSKSIDAVEAHPVAELLECPPEVGLLLNRSAV